MERAETLWGWNQDLDIPAAVARLDQSWLDQKYVLISGLDSSFDMRGVVDPRPLLDDLNAESWALGRHIAIEGPTFGHLLWAHEYFGGFDEVWFFDEMPVDQEPDAPRLTTDRKLLERPASVLTNWLQENRGVAGLGDGDDLNWITPSVSLADLWRARGASDQMP